jgi:hypothetical protein
VDESVGRDLEQIVSKVLIIPVHVANAQWSQSYYS